MWQYVAIMAENLTIELLENVIFWEKHPEIYQSLESFIRERYKVIPKNLEKKEVRDGVRFLLETICEARIESSDKLRYLEPELSEKFTIEKI